MIMNTLLRSRVASTAGENLFIQEPHLTSRNRLYVAATTVISNKAI